jgi:S-(hydroxymethyl)glutathione dehydrogenase/alcohol dehydrogenase
MKAALLTMPGTPLEIATDIDIAPPRAGEVRVAVKHCGLCHSDLHIIEGKMPAPLPVILGHEAAGIVDAVGPGVDQLAVGDHVVLTAIPACGRCYWCVRGENSMCINLAALQTAAFPDGTTGLSRRGETVYRGLGLAGFAEYMVTSATGAAKIPADMPLELACVLGLGGVGISVVQGARIAGASRIIVSDPVPERRTAAVRFGATDLLDPAKDDLMQACMDLTGVGVDYAFETAGRASLIQGCVAATRPGGTTVTIGVAPFEETLELGPAVMFTASEKKLMGCMLGSSNALRDLPRFAALWKAGRLDLEGMITMRRPLSEINEAIADLQASRGIRTALAL